MPRCEEKFPKNAYQIIDLFSQIITCINGVNLK